jgi:hypothetical protein
VGQCWRSSTDEPPLSPIWIHPAARAKIPAWQGGRNFKGLINDLRCANGDEFKACIDYDKQLRLV